MSRRGVELLFATWIFPEQGQQFKSDTPGATGHELVLPTQQRHLSPLGIQPAPGMSPPHSHAGSHPTNSTLCSQLFRQGFFCKALQTKLRKELGEQVSLFHASYRWELQVFQALKASFIISEPLYLKLLRRCTCPRTSVSATLPGLPSTALCSTRSCCFISPCSGRHIIAVTGNGLCSSQE